MNNSTFDVEAERGPEGRNESTIWDAKYEQLIAIPNRSPDVQRQTELLGKAVTYDDPLSFLQYRRDECDDDTARRILDRTFG